jgi:AraC family transcriptional regulator of adaptative response/methylated-DNA-[protein]-cysteine methyltransferase
MSGLLSIPATTELQFAVGQCSLGSVLVAQGERGVCAILLGDEPEAVIRELAERFPRTELVRRDADLTELVSQVVGLVETPARPLDLLLDLRGTTFQQRVWQALRLGPQRPTRKWPAGSGPRGPCEQWPTPVPSMPSQLRSPVIG